MALVTIGARFTLSTAEQEQFYQNLQDAQKALASHPHLVQALADMEKKFRVDVMEWEENAVVCPDCGCIAYVLGPVRRNGEAHYCLDCDNCYYRLYRPQERIIPTKEIETYLLRREIELKEENKRDAESIFGKKDQ